MRPMSSVRALVHWILVAWVALAPAFAGASEKTLRVAFAAAETSFDPAFAYDVISSAVFDNIMESMLDYDYLVRPFKLVPASVLSKMSTKMRRPPHPLYLTLITKLS